MKKTVTASMLMPTYVSRFTCIGSDCEDTCCAGWDITLDKESLLLYQSSFDPVLRPLFTKYVKRNPGATSAADHGHMELIKGDCLNCGLLSEKKLCLIQERLGEAALSDTCTNYPRKICHLGDLHQMTLMLSCPEAARLALLAKDAFDFTGEEHTVRRGTISEVKPRFGMTLALMDDVRTFLFQVLRSEDLPLLDRLKVLGLCCGRLTDLIEKLQAKAIPELLLSLEGELESGAAMAPLVGLEEHPEVQAQFTSAFFVARRKAFQTPHQRRVLDEVAKGLGIQEDGTPDRPTLVRAYALGLSRLAPALEGVPWLLEHYLFNEALRELFPWGMGNPRLHYANLVIRFATARMMLVGRAAAHEAPLTPFELAETLQVYCRLYLHSANFTQGSDQTLVEMGWDRLEKLHALL